MHLCLILTTSKQSAMRLKLATSNPFSSGTDFKNDIRSFIFCIPALTMDDRKAARSRAQTLQSVIAAIYIYNNVDRYLSRSKLKRYCVVLSLRLPLTEAVRLQLYSKASSPKATPGFKVPRVLES